MLTVIMEFRCDICFGPVADPQTFSIPAGGAMPVAWFPDMLGRDHACPACAKEARALLSKARAERAKEKT